MKFLTSSPNQYPIPVSSLEHLSCKSPFKWIEIQESGDISICCYTWMPVMIGNILDMTTEEIFNNVIRSNVLTQISNGDFSNCTDYCPHLTNYLQSGKIDNSPSGFLVNKISLQNKLSAFPWMIKLSYDRSCNLQCASCRKNLILLRPEDNHIPEVNKLVKIHTKVKELIQYLIDKNERTILTITGSGDAFASPIFWSYLIELSQQKLPSNFYLNLMTNGIMMTEQNWNEIKPLWKHIRYVNISIDAASESIYKIVRKNGNFSRLKNNLTFFDNLVKEKAFTMLAAWSTAFVVQKINYHELKEFVEWQLSYKTISKIDISLIAQWGHLSIEEYNNMLLTKKDQAIMSDMLTDPVFNNPKISLGSINQYKNTPGPL
jgi:pyruvate-formate lyase-activating enzyme